MDRHLIVIVVGLVSIAVTVIALGGTLSLLSSPLVPMELAAVATAITLRRRAASPG